VIFELAFALDDRRVIERAFAFKREQLILGPLADLIALGLDWGLLMLLVRSGVNYLIAATISFSAGMVFAYFSSIIFVYRGRRAYQVPAEVIGFFLIGLAGLLVNVFLLFVFVKLCGLSVGLGKVPTALAVFLFNFLVRRTLLFTSAPIVAALPEKVRSPVEFNY